MSEKRVPFSREFIEGLVSRYPTPFHIYDEEAIVENARSLKHAFDWVPDRNGNAGGYRNYFAVKALPNPHVMKILRDEGMGFDCSSLAELLLAERVGVTGESIMFTSNDTPLYEYRKAKELGAVINLDDITHLPFLDEHLGLPGLLCMRYNPGSLKEGNVIIGKPEEAKYGFTLFLGVRLSDEGYDGQPMNFIVPDIIEATQFNYTEAVHILNADEHYNKYLKTTIINRIKETSDLPFFEPVQMYSNIKNGYGIFGSCTITSIKL